MNKSQNGLPYWEGISDINILIIDFENFYEAFVRVRFLFLICEIGTSTSK